MMYMHLSMRGFRDQTANISSSQRYTYMTMSIPVYTIHYIGSRIQLFIQSRLLLQVKQKALCFFCKGRSFEQKLTYDTIWSCLVDVYISWTLALLRKGQNVYRCFPRNFFSNCAVHSSAYIYTVNFWMWTLSFFCSYTDIYTVNFWMWTPIASFSLSIPIWPNKR
jgi:hypothetical protein